MGGAAAGVGGGGGGTGIISGNGGNGGSAGFGGGGGAGGSGSQSGGGAAGGFGGGGGGTNTVTWNGSLASGGSVTITITATINAGTAGSTVSNQGTIAFDADGNGTNESAGLTDDPNVSGSNNPTSFDVNAAGGTFRFSQGGYTTPENFTSVTVTVERTGDTRAAATVDYSTADRTATQRSDYTLALGTLHFAAGETSKAITLLVNEDSYAEGTEAFAVELSNPTGGSVISQPSVGVEITDDVPETEGNPNDTTEEFVRQHYHDFLNREPDAEGLAFWKNAIDSCGSDPACREVRRVNVSAAFFLSIEFKETGCLVYHFYTTSLDRPDSLPGYAEFLRDTQAVQRGVIMGTDGWEAKLEANKRAYAEGFVSRAEFLALYPLTMTPGDYVDALFTHARLTPSAAERQAAVAEFGGAGTIADAGARARALRRVAGSEALHERDVNRAFVLMQYFGYLRRDPRAAPDADLSGYNFWLSRLDQFDGDFIRAEMVKAFISSEEYRKRFAQ